MASELGDDLSGWQDPYFENKVVRGYLSSNDPIVHFGLGKFLKIDSIRVCVERRLGKPHQKQRMQIRPWR